MLCDLKKRDAACKKKILKPGKKMKQNNESRYFLYDFEESLLGAIFEWCASTVRHKATFDRLQCRRRIQTNICY